MGVWHFAGLGRSPGAVTAGLSYLKNEIGDTQEYGKIVDGLVIFTSPEILNGKERAYTPVADNKYMTRTVNKKWTERFDNSFEIVKEFLHREFSDFEFYVCKVDVNDFSACFEAIAKALLKFHPPSEVGKHIWANLTGGTNVLNAALIQVAYFSGFIPLLYYTFVADIRENGKFLKPFSRSESDFDFRKIYVFNTEFDKKYQYILEELESVKDWVTSSELLAKLKGAHPELFGNMNLALFKRNFLNVMLGVERKGSRAEGQEDFLRLSKDGEKTLEILRYPLFNTLIKREIYPESEIQKLINTLEIERID